MGTGTVTGTGVRVGCVRVGCGYWYGCTGGPWVLVLVLVCGWVGGGTDPGMRVPGGVALSFTLGWLVLHDACTHSTHTHNERTHAHTQSRTLSWEHAALLQVEAAPPPPQVLQEMLDMLRDHQNNFHAARLEWIIIWLLVVDVVLMLFQLASLFGLV